MPKLQKGLTHKVNDLLQAYHTLKYLFWSTQTREMAKCFLRAKSSCERPLYIKTLIKAPCIDNISALPLKVETPLASSVLRSHHSHWNVGNPVKLQTLPLTSAAQKHAARKNFQEACALFMFTFLNNFVKGVYSDPSGDLKPLGFTCLKEAQEYLFLINILHDFDAHSLKSTFSINTYFII